MLFSDLQNQQPQQVFLHHPAIPHPGMTVTDATCSSNMINTTIQQPIFNYPGFTPNHHQPIPMNITEHNQHPVTSFLSYPSSTNMIHHQINHHQQSHNNVTPMESDNENHFTLVKRKRKKTKIDRVHNETPSSCSSSSSSITNTTSSTSSTNTNSIISNVPPPNSNRTQIKTGKNDETSVVSNSIEITHEARRFHETRYAFPSFIVKFNQDVDEKGGIKFISSYYSTNYDFDLKFAGHRLKGKRNLLLFANDRETFLILFNEFNWPSTIESLTYEKILPNHLPAQFSILLRSVPTHLDVCTLLTSIQNDYPDVINAFRINFCKFCGAGVNDLNEHKLNCDKKLSCLRCKGEHDANDMRCPIIKTYRSALTKSILTTAGINNLLQQNQTNYWFNNDDYPVLNVKNFTKHHHRSVNNIANDADLNNNHSDQFIGLQQVVMNHIHDLQLQQIDTSFQRDFISH
ncbi:unnamed protein product [Rotaria sordida]|uniref:Uncharacterized protein n=1 Tax=Rotaria sordida TaxID=392033 RepID=A0A819A185_9BILA|nr:unnamed protein product [Rotaria sordida]